MSTFEYTALDLSNVIRHGIVKGWTRNNAQRLLERNELTIVTLAKVAAKHTKRRSIFRHVTKMDRMLFTRNLMTMMRAGLTLTEALASCREQTSNSTLYRIIEDAERSVVAGQSLSSVFMRHEYAFPAVFRAMIHMGERGGKLVDVLEYLARQQEQDIRLTRKIRTALAYPTLILTTMVTMVVLMMLFVIPKIAGVYEESGATLPLATRILITASSFIVRYGAYILIGVVAVGIIARILVKKSSRVRMALHKFSLTLPIIGTVFKKVELVIISRSLAMLTHAGISFDEALGFTSTIAHNMLYQKAMTAAQQFVRRGVKLRDVFKGNPELFLPVFYKMVVTGEQTGNLDEMFDRIGQYYDEDVQHWTSNLTTYIEPLLLLGTAGIVAGIAAAILIPLWNFTNVI